MFGVGEWKGPSGVEVLREDLLSLLDGSGSVLGGDFGEAWELLEICGGREVVVEDGDEGFGDWHARRCWEGLVVRVSGKECV